MADDPQDQQGSTEEYHDELAAARRKELEAEAEATGVSVEELEAQGGLQAPVPAPEADGQGVFFIEQGRQVNFGTIIKRGTDVEYRVKFGGMSIKGKGTPVPLDTKDLVLAGRYMSGGLNFVPSHDEEGNITKITVYATLKPQTTPVDVTSVDGRTLVGSASVLSAVSAMRAEGLSETAMRREFKAALDETAETAAAA